METLAILALLLVLVAAVAPGAYILRKRMVARGELEFWRVLHRCGLGAADIERDPRALGMAARRCVFCPNVDQCADWLASGKREGLEEFCPNAPYLKRLEHQ